MTHSFKLALGANGAWSRILPIAAVAASLSFFIDGTVNESTAFETGIAQKDLAKPQQVYSPFAGRDYPDQVLFGDAHFHTDLSFDAGLVGTTLTAHEGFRFARGERVFSNTGQPVQLIRPLDFLAITDHAEMMGLAPALNAADPLLLSDPWGKWAYDQFNAGVEGRMALFGDIIERATVKGENPFSSDDLTRSIWRQFIEIAEQYNDPGTFTTLAGFEWTFTPKGDNLHRVILFADGAEKTSQTAPLSFFDAPDPELLWDYLSAYEEDTGGRAIAIPHNGNLSNGLMFTDKQFNGDPITREYAEKRIRWEPLHEMSQIKGDEETHPLLSPDDEFADFENWDASNLGGSAPKEEWMLKHEYGRSALKLGLQLEAKLGANPFKFGMNASTDTHTALATTREENFFGKYQHTEPSAERHNRDVIPASDPSLRIITAQESASGLTAVWARENNRREIFDSMTRKEVYATTGTRIRVRVFGGWNYTADDHQRPDFVSHGYRNGVPMGGDLIDAPSGRAPSFLIRALRDPDGANLDRIQIIKGWLDARGETQERIFDVAVSDGREIGADGRARQPVGSTVDIENATYTNAIGAPLLAGHWVDPDFDAAERALYYVRVLEIPTPRWTTYDAAVFEVPLPEAVPPTVQDRAYTSPIWYTP